MLGSRSEINTEHDEEDVDSLNLGQSESVTVTRNERPLSKLNKFCYSIGHIHNDLCASMWFTFLLIFFKEVIGLPSLRAANLLLIGQVTDGIVTPLVGILSDRVRIPCYGSRKFVHFIGTVLIAIGFPFIFRQAVTPSLTDVNNIWYFIYYIPFIILFQLGWGTIQISHLAIVPELSKCEHIRNTLISLRFGFLILANIFVYVVCSFFLKLQQKNETQKFQDWKLNSNLSDINVADQLTDDLSFDIGKIGPQDLRVFQALSLLVTIVGLFFTFLYHVGVPEQGKHWRNRSRNTGQDDGQDERLIHEDLDQSERDRKNQLQITDWLFKFKFYGTAIAYMSARLVANLLMVYVPFFATYTLTGLKKEWVAYLPLLMYIAGFVITFVVKIISKKKIYLAYILGLILTLIPCIICLFINSQQIWLIVVTFALFGFGANALVCSGLELITEMIGSNTKTGGFVFGFMSLRRGILKLDSTYNSWKFQSFFKISKLSPL